MGIEKPIFWHQGLFLQPQHLQLTDLYHQSLIAPLYRFIGPYFWGVVRLQVAEAALSNFVFEIQHGEFLFQDNSYAAIHDNAVMRSRSFEDCWPNKEEPLPVFIGLRRFNSEGGNVGEYNDESDLADLNTRFVASFDADEVVDLYQQGPDGQVKKLSFLLKLFFGSEKEQATNYQLIELAQLEVQADEIILSENFIPPMVTLQTSQQLLTLARDVSDQIASRGRQLEAYKRQRGIHTAEFGARDMVYLLALRTLNRYIPLLHSLLTAQHTHPWQLYTAARQLIGELSTFSGEVSVMGKLADGGLLLNEYDHSNLSQSYRELQSTVTRLLDEITAGPEYVINLLYDGTYFASELQPAIFDGRNRYYLVIESDEDPQQIIEALLGIAKLATRESLPLFIARALPGVGLEHLTIPPQELPRRANCLYFQIDHHSEPWANVQQLKNLALYWDKAPEDLKVELMVVGRN
ncbi:type VI secretion system baseplate subunit TssK [Malonomonas rubra]|uniref:type VI secretion system baseplate subunit TssK n=1 Tax=Malonomonas rubra TaxID=57040 RepID=UPI0026F169FE|nr:type VI secretion system baseplate subunit TssK [Malonomonas rubra]